MRLMPTIDSNRSVGNRALQKMWCPYTKKVYHLRDCSSCLPDDQRQLLRGYYFADDSIEVLATRFGRGSEAVYKSLQRIRQALQLCIQRKLQTEA